jgi:hypothetical protein
LLLAFSQKAHVLMFFTAGDNSTLRRNEGNYSPWPL